MDHRPRAQASTRCAVLRPAVQLGMHGLSVSPMSFSVPVVIEVQPAMYNIPPAALPLVHGVLLARQSLRPAAELAPGGHLDSEIHVSGNRQ